MSMRELPYASMNHTDSVTSVTNNPLASNESQNYERDERLEPTLVLNDPSGTQLATLSPRIDSADRVQDPKA